MHEYLEIGKIVNTHGIKGEIKVIPLTDDPRRFNRLKWVYIDTRISLEKYHVDNVCFFKGLVIVKLKEVNDINAAETLKDMYIKVDRKNAVKLPKYSYFTCDLIGCEVFRTDGVKLGKISDVLKTGSNDVFVVENKVENKREILIPALKTVVKEVSVKNNRVVLDIPEGLMDE